ncbi:MAG: hypothetical protein K2X79_03355 [Burkholderiaceae bacterium]|nr:hypothetical protein [Burkholderiaceae bacterium]
MNYRLRLGASLITMVMAACAQEAPYPASTVQAASAQRLIIRFTTAQAVWNAAELAHLRTTLAVDLQPVAAVSDTTWVYTVQLQRDQIPSTLLQALRKRPEVAHVEADLRIQNP